MAQTSPQLSTVSNPIWYTIESTAITSLGTPNSTLSSLLPLKDKGYVLYSPTSAGKILYRISTGADTEKWAIVVIGDKNYLYNKATGLYMSGSHSVASFNANDSVRFTSLGSGQYAIRTSITNSYTIAWNSLTCDRWSGANKDSNTSWIFKAVDTNSAKAQLATSILAANAAKQANVGEDPGYISSTSQSAIDLMNAINSAQNSYNSSVTDADYSNAKTNLDQAVNTFLASPRNPIIVSTSNNDTWYYIVNGSDVAYCSGKVIVNKASTTGTALQFTDKKIDPNMLWKMIDAGGGKYAIQNKATGKYIALNIANGTQDAIAAYSITSVNSNGRFKINAGSGDLHPQDAGSTIVNWNEDGTWRSTWRFQTISNTDAQTPMNVTSTQVSQGRLATGIGNTDFAVIYFNAQVEGFTGEAILESIKMNFQGTTNLNDINNIRLYKTTDLKFNPSTAILLANSNTSTGEITFSLTNPLNLNPGSNYFCVVVDVSASANEGNMIDASITTLKLKDKTEQAVAQPSPSNAATIFLTQSILFSPGDYNSVSYRIPSIVTAKDGSLVTSTDKRNFHSGDLAADIDQYVRRSTDNGKTWSDVLMTCGYGTSLGYGDPAMVVDRVTGKIICLVVHDKGFFYSTSTNPTKVIAMESSDNGQTWSTPKDITNQLYGANCPNSATQNWAGMFISSGRGLQLRNGRIMFAAVVRDGVKSGLQVYSVYTDDLGISWKVGNASAIDGGDESKFTEKNNGNIVVSVRKAPKRYTNVSTDNGLTWGIATQHADLTDPACNGEILTYTSTLDGYNKNRMLHSLCYAGNRSNVSMLLSYDEGNTFPIRKTICAGSSAYSTFTILNDGTIGVYFEDGSTGNTFDMVFVRFSLKWLSNGTDEYTMPNNATNTIQPSKKKVKVIVRNKKIEVVGTDKPYEVFNMQGTKMSNNKLKTGVYLVKAEGDTYKICID